MTRFLLKRTTTEEFDYDPDKLRRDFAFEFNVYCEGTTEMRARYGFPRMTDDEMWESFVIELFEKHDGSQYGDSLFSSTASDNIGVELYTKGDDE
jgi:hypothetical protein